jgi:hypothetical protein
MAVPPNQLHDLNPRPDEALFEDIDDKLLAEDERVELATIAEMVSDRGVLGLTVAQFVRMKQLQAKGRQQVGKEYCGRMVTT